ncbi:MAG: cell wall-binding repeat-containing protein, partial [Gracilibacteraceae bacterium]|nr:cell wall-binding repeat-containing protein [Gracilibacteraceae bacterium]
FAVDGSVSATGRELTDNAFFLSENGSNYLTGGADARQTLNPVNAYDGRTPAYAAPAMELRVNREFGDWTVSEFYIDGEAYSGYSTAGGGPLDQIFDGAANDPSYPNLTNYLKITLPAGWTSENGTRAIHAVLTKGDENVLLFAKTEITGITPRYALTVTGGTGGGLYPAGTIAPIQGVLPVWNAEFLGWTQAAESGDAGYIAALPAEISGAVVMPAGDAALTAQYTRPAPSPNGGTGSGGGGAAVPPPPAQPPATPQRTVSQADISYISGADRVATAVAVSRTGWSQSAAVVIAPGAQANLIDALAADPYAGQLGAPVLLGMGETPDPAVIAEIQRLGAGSVVVVGALGDAYVAALQAALPGVKIEILRGGNRLETALLLAGKIENPRGAIVVGYDALADAVSVASWAAAHSYLIIPAGVDGSFTPPANLPAPEGGENYIIGGPTLVRDIPGYTRIYGADRYATNLLIRQTLDFELDLVYTANGVTVVDALTGAPLAAKTNSPIVLLRDGDLAGADFGPITAETKVFAFGFGG